MSQSTRTQIDNMQALTASGSITPSSLGVILESIETELDGNDSSYTGTTINDRAKALETTSSNLSTRMTAAESDIDTLQSSSTTQGNNISNLLTRMTAVESKNTSQDSTLSGHSSQISALQTATSMGGSTYGGTNTIAPLAKAIPFYKNAIVTEDDYPTKYVIIVDAANTTIDFSSIKNLVSQFYIDCRDSITLDSKLDSASVNHLQKMVLIPGALYRLTILIVLDTTQHSSYNLSDIEYHAFIEQLI